MLLIRPDFRDWRVGTLHAPKRGLTESNTAREKDQWPKKKKEREAGARKRKL